MVHKINCLHKPPRLVDFSLQQKEGKNEKYLYIRNHFDGTDSLRSAQTQAAAEPAATDMPQAGMPNPASVYCKQNGNKLEIRTAADGSQNGICVFPDGSTCDEWAYFRGECGPAAQKSPTPAIVLRQPQQQVMA